jgi:hypothetical protein
MMNILVEHIDTKGKTHNRTFKMSRLAFVKHLAVAGQGYAPKPQKLLRTVGMFFHYSYYLKRSVFNDGGFAEPPVPLSDPTEKGQFSNLAGKAIADFLTKRIDNALYTVNYEAAMRQNGFPLTGKRPDLISYSPKGIFAIEAKGRHQNNSGNMLKHKKQAQSGPIPVNFSVACVCYNLFNQVTCKYHDPFNENVPFDNNSLQALTRDYYSGLAEFLNPKIFDYRETRIQGEDFYEIELSYKNVRELLSGEPELWPFGYSDLFRFYRPRLILPKTITELAETGITNQTAPFNYDIGEQDRNIYIDNDRVGLSIY